jgi:hypothetical protein
MIDAVKLINEIDEFNKKSLNKIQLSIEREINEYRAFGHTFPFMIPPPENYKFVFEIFNHKGNKESSTTVYEDYANEALQMDKLICNNADLMLKIHNHIIDNCYSIIEQHKKSCIEWENYLFNWDKRCYLSIYKTYEDAVSAKEKFQNSLLSKIKDSLKTYNPVVLEEINSLNKSIKNNREQIKKFSELLFDKGIRLKCFQSFNDEILYNFDLN